MSAQAPIDAVQFAREGRRLEGEIAVAAMERLHDVLAEAIGTVGYSVQGSIDAKRRAVLEVRVGGTLPLICQRCLERMDYELRRTSRFVVAEEGQALPDVADEDPDTETMPPEVLADVADLVEQEVLLGLPIAPTHAAGTCDAATDGAADPRPSPFAVLEQLKHRS